MQLAFARTPQNKGISMKTGVFATTFALLLSTAAQGKPLLNCSYIAQTDIRSARVEALKDLNYVHLTLVSPAGLKQITKIDSEQYREGWIELPAGDMYERYLMRTNEGWEIFSTQGPKTYRAKAQCEEAPL